MSRLIWLLAGAAVCGVLMALAGLAVIETGSFDARASTPHARLVAWATHTTMIHSMQRGAAKVQPPPAFTPEETEAGFRLYERDCLVCHGGPGTRRGALAQGMNPSPPFLLDASGRWTRGQLFWIVRNGVKMTGMPAWETVDSDGQIWDLVAFLEAMPWMKPADFQNKVAQDRAATAAEAPPP